MRNLPSCLHLHECSSARFEVLKAASSPALRARCVVLAWAGTGAKVALCANSAILSFALACAFISYYTEHISIMAKDHTYEWLHAVRGVILLIFQVGRANVGAHHK